MDRQNQNGKTWSGFMHVPPVVEPKYKMESLQMKILRSDILRTPERARANIAFNRAAVYDHAALPTLDNSVLSEICTRLITVIKCTFRGCQYKKQLLWQKNIMRKRESFTNSIYLYVFVKSNCAVVSECCAL